MESYTTEVRTRLTREQHARLVRLAQRRGASLATYVRMLILDHLHEVRESEQSLPRPE